MIYRDRWTRADEDEDDILKEEEFLAFLHPEHCKTMLNLLVDELLHDFGETNKHIYIVQLQVHFHNIVRVFVSMLFYTRTASQSASH